MRSTKRVGRLPTPKIEVRDYRKELWIKVAVAMARAENTRDNTAPGRWANQALSDYDKQFGSSR